MNETFGFRLTTYETVNKEDGYDKSVLGIINETGILSARPFSFKRHGRLLHSWCNQPYSAKFWNMAGSYGDLVNYYKQRQLTEGVSHTIFSVNNSPVAFTECYPVIGSELQAHIAGASSGDFGIHFLMAPPRQIAKELRPYKRSLSFITLRAALDLAFNNSQIHTIYAEPDRENQKACHLADVVGFEFIKEIQLSDKVAHMVRYKKEYMNC